MDNNNIQLPVPFPTLTRQPDEAEKADDGASVHSRVHSSPTSPNPWLLGYPKFKKKLSVTSSGSPRRAHVPLTPPLTPSSSFNSASGNESSDRDNDVESHVPSTPPDSPLRKAAWNAVHGKRRTLSTFGGGGIYMSPGSGESDVGSVDFVLRRRDSGSALATASPTDSVDSITPRMEETLRLDSGESNDHSKSPSQSKLLGGSAVDILTTFSGVPEVTRFLLLRNIPPLAPYDSLLSVLSPTTDIKGIHLRFQKSHGVVILAFYDVRRAKMKRDLLDGMQVKELSQATIPAESEHDARIEGIFVCAEHIEELIPNSEFVITMPGMLYVTVEGRRLTTDAIRGVLASYGDLRDFSLVESGEHQQKFRVEYFNVREAATACSSLRERSFFGAIVRTYFPGQEPHASERPLLHLASAGTVYPSLNSGVPRNEIDLTSPAKSSVVLPEDYKRRPRSVSAGSHDSGRKGLRDGRGRSRERDTSLPPDDEFGSIRLRNASTYDRNMQPPPSPSRRRSISMGPEPERDGLIPFSPQGSNMPFGQHGSWSSGPQADSPVAVTNGYGYSQHAPVNPYASQYPPAPLHGGYHIGMPPPTPQLFHALPPQQQQLVSSDGFMHPGLPHVDHGSWSQPYAPALQGVHSNGAMEFYPPAPPGLHNHPRSVRHAPKKSYYNRDQGQYGFESAPSSPTDTYRGYQPRMPRSSNHSISPTTPTSATDPLITSFPSLNPPTSTDTTQKNQLDLAAIEKGVDTRTTVMVKNIPNKMTDKDLLDFIERVCPRRIDFLYLRMDFQNGCNVGYAFVNFITVQDLLHFASTQLGVKWNMYSSEKYLQLSYANYQGKEALVEKFKNSCIMDERESWRPKIFYSSGPNAGLPEPFPSPTHLRRKERSAHNRGALFVPGPGSQHHHLHHGHHGGRGGSRQGYRSQEGGMPEFRQFPSRLSI